MKLYTQEERKLNDEAGENKARILSALWVRGVGPRGGKINMDQHRYDALNLLVIERKASVITRFNSSPLYSDMMVDGIVIHFPKIRDTPTKAPSKNRPTGKGPKGYPPWD